MYYRTPELSGSHNNVVLGWMIVNHLGHEQRKECIFKRDSHDFGNWNVPISYEVHLMISAVIPSWVVYGIEPESQGDNACGGHKLTPFPRGWHATIEKVRDLAVSDARRISFHMNDTAIHAGVFLQVRQSGCDQASERSPWIVPASICI